MTDGAVIFFAITIVAGALIWWLANIFTIRIPEVVRQVYFTVIICFVIYLLFTFLHTT